jgi:uncharacterized repeat protein (TIGR03833 family)
MPVHPSNEDIQVGMKVLAELKKDRGTGKLTEGIVKKKLTTVAYDDNGIVVLLEKDQKEIEHQGRVHKILDPNFIDKNNDENKTIQLNRGENHSNRVKIINLLSNSEEFLWLAVGYFKHKHFEILSEVLHKNSSIQDIKIITGLPLIKGKVEPIEFELIKTYADGFKKEFKDISIDLKFLTEKKIGSKTHARFYFTKNQAWTFIDLDIMLTAQTEVLTPLPEFEKNVNDNFDYFWNQPSTLSLFGNGYGSLLTRVEKLGYHS